MLADFFHDQLHFVKGHRVATGDLNHNRIGIIEQAPLIEQRTLQCLFNGLMGPVIALGEAVSEETAAVFGIECGKKIIHPDPDDAGSEDHVHGGTNALADNLVSSRERLSHTVLGNDEFAHSIIVKSDNSIGVLTDDLKSIACLLSSTSPLKGERHCCKDNKEDTFFSRDPANFRSSSRAGATAKTNAEKNDSLFANRCPDFIDSLERSLLTERRITTGPHPFQKSGSKLNLVTRNGGRESSHICI